MVIPVYNVERYLLECLRSVAQQDPVVLEIIAVDDGSTDRSGQVLAEFAAGDPRVVIVTKSNAGLGAARNTGLAAATGEFVTFVDSDDIVPPGSYAAMLRTLNRSGSQFVVGCPQRMDPTRTWVAPWAQRLHATDRLAITVADMPGIVGDVFACNKVFRRQFFDEVVGRFPVGVRYEDQEPALRAYLGADSLDVLRRITYSWRMRPDGASITQQKAQLADLVDRSLVMTRACRDLLPGAPQEVRRAWLGKALGFDLSPYFAQVPRTDDTYWAQLCALVRTLAGQAEVGSWTVARVNDRALAWAALHDDRDDAITILTSMSTLGTSFPVISTQGGLLALPPYLADLAHPVPEHLREVTGELDLVTRVDGWHWLDDRTVGIRGAAYVEHLPDLVVPEGHPRVELSLVDLASGDRRALEVLTAEAADPEIGAGDRWISHVGARFRVEINTADLRGPVVWHLCARVLGGGVDLEGPVATVSAADSSGRLVAGPVTDGRRVLGGLRRTGPGQGRGLALWVRTPRWVAQDAAMAAGAGLQVVVAEAPSAARWSTSKGHATEVAPQLDTSEDGRVRVTVPLPAAQDSGQLRLEFTTRDTDLDNRAAAEPSPAWHPVEMSGCMDLHDAADPGGLRSARVTIDASGHLILRPQAHRVTATSVELDAISHVLTVGGILEPPPESGPDLRLLPEGGDPPAIDASVTLDQGGFSAMFDLLDADGRPHPPGSLFLTLVTGNHEQRVEVSRGVEVGLRRQVSTPRMRVVVARTPRRGTLKITIRPPLAREERGAYNRARLEHRYRRQVEAGSLRPAVLFECFAGKFAGDSVKQLSLELARSGRAEALGLDLLWSVRDFSVPVPESATPILRFSTDWFTALATSAYLVNNNNFPNSFRKANGQVYVQTWHGTPLKRIGDDVPASSLSLQYRALMKREVVAWDHLLAQNQYSAEIFGPAFGYSGPIHVLGYPRNDRLADTHATQLRQHVRAALGLNDHQFLVLYTPTWRDSAKDTHGKYEMVSHLDERQWFAQAPADWVLGVRGHVNTKRLRDSDARVLDLTSHPDIAELYLAADALVTDYSSTMFDFSVTGKPIAFLVPDLAEYGDTTRGLYFDLAEIAPGPLVNTTTELVRVLRDLTALKAAFAEKYTAWTTRFNPLDDGKAAGRIVDAIWG